MGENKHYDRKFLLHFLSEKSTIVLWKIKIINNFLKMLANKLGGIN